MVALFSALGLAAALQSGPDFSTHEAIQRYKWDKCAKLTDVNMHLTVDGQDPEDSSSEAVFIMQRSGSIFNAETKVSDYHLAMVTDGKNGYLVSHHDKSYLPIAVPNFDDLEFELEPPTGEEVSFKFNGMALMFTSGVPLKVKSVKEEAVNGHKLMAAVYEYRPEDEDDDTFVRIREWFDLQTGIVHRFSILTERYGERSVVSGWLDLLELKWKGDLSDKMFDPAKHSDYIKQV